MMEQEIKEEERYIFLKELQKLDLADLQELQSIISKNVEKSELEKYYLYTYDPTEKAKIFIWCYRFLYSIYNLTKDSDLKRVIQEETQHNYQTYILVHDLLHKSEKSHFNRHRNLEKLRILLTRDKNIDDLIDAFCILLEKTSVLSISRLKGFSLEGQSGKEFKKIFGGKQEIQVIEPEVFEGKDDFGEKGIQDEVIDEFTQVNIKSPEQEVKNEEIQETQEVPKEFIGEGILPEEKV